MISWIQRSFQHHFKAVFGVLLVVTVVSFVIALSPGSNAARGGRTIAQESFFGRNLASQAEMNQIINDAQLSIELRGGYANRDDERAKDYGLQRVAALKMADDLHLPTPAPDSPEVKDFIEHLAFFAGPNGQFDPQKYATFQANLASSGRGDADIARVVTDDTRIMGFITLLTGPGYVLPSDVKTELARYDTTWSVSTATVDYASYHPEIATPEAALVRYFQTNAARYQIPPEVSASYVDFNAFSYFLQVKVSDAEVRAFYDQDPSRFTKPKSAAKPVKPDPNADFAAVKTQVEGALKMDRAKTAALKDASDFAVALYENKIAYGPALDAYLASRHLREQPLAPFAENAPPPELGGSPDIADAAFHLSPDRYFSDALPTPIGAAVLIWKADLPARQPLFAEVRDKVKADYLASEKARLFAELGRALKTRLAAEVKGGKSFDQAVAIAAAAAGVKITPRNWTAFTLRDRPKDLDETVPATLLHLKPGEFSDMAVASDNGCIVYAAGARTPDLSERNPHYAQIRQQIAAYFAQVSAGDYLHEVVQREMARAKAAVQ